jgi:hypothetical protein
MRREAPCPLKRDCRFNFKFERLAGCKLRKAKESLGGGYFERTFVRKAKEGVRMVLTGVHFGRVW